MFHSGTMFLQYFTTEINAAATLFWTFGDLSKATYPVLLVLSGIFLLSFILIWASHWKFDALGFEMRVPLIKVLMSKHFVLECFFFHRCALLWRLVFLELSAL